MNFNVMKEFMDRLTSWRIPGNSISVFIENEEVFNYQSGYECIESGRKMRGDELFNVFSCSKPVTVTAALQLYERGYFLLDDPLYEFIPEFRHMYVKEGGQLREAKTPITLRHLFTMTSGITYQTNTPAFEKARRLTDGKMNTLAVIKCLAEDPLAFDPGENWKYALNHDVLAAVVEVISGKRFRDYVSENIFLPLGMKESYYHNEAVLDRVAELYRYVDSPETDIVKLQTAGLDACEGKVINVGKAVPHIFGTEYDSGGAGITTSVSDYSKFATALANGGVGANGERILAPGTIELMRQNQLSPDQLKTFCHHQYLGYGYGLGVRTMMDLAGGGSCGSIGEFGWGGAAGATVLVDPDRKLSMFYTHHMLNPQERYYQPRLRNVLYTCIE